MPNNPGCVYQRADGKWCASLQDNGRRRTVYGKSEREARKKLADLQKQLATNGTLPDPGRRTVAELLDAWLQTADLRPKTMAGYRQTLALVLPNLGHLRLARLEPVHLQRLYADLGKTSKRNAYRSHLLLHHALKLAVLWGWLPANPAERVIKPQYRAERKEVWAAEQLRAFLAGTGGHVYGPLWTLAVCTGCRLAELVGLRWQDVDTASGAVAVKRTLQRVGSQWVESPPKTKAGERTIALPPEALTALRRQKALQGAQRLKAGPEWQDLGLVFTSPTGKPLQQTWVQNAMRAECDRLALPRLTPHGLRHLHASLLLAEGLPVPAVSARLGHASPAITMAIYAHAMKRQDTEAAQAIAKAMAR